ncbi:unnamed protein product [Symbiodinium sp. KB8]|nr:unnamed protein product [Symbiodinium sp. KB8]
MAGMDDADWLQDSASASDGDDCAWGAEADSRSMQRQFQTAGIREGIDAGREASIQVGFDAGFATASRISFELSKAAAIVRHTQPSPASDTAAAALSRIDAAFAQLKALPTQSAAGQPEADALLREVAAISAAAGLPQGSCTPDGVGAGQDHAESEITP